MNLPNKLTCLRMIMIPFFLFFLIFPEVCGFTVSRIVAAVLFALTAFTDMLDGKIARKYNLVTDFGKFMDPLADKLMVFGAMFGILILNREDASLAAFEVFGVSSAELFTKIFVWCAFIIVFRELAVTSMRMIVSNAEGIVIAANIFGKIKTVSQIIGIVVIIIEPIIWGGLIASYVMLAIMVFSTLFSGFSYFKAYWPHINSNK
ncbi:MAG: CDP-alcohol phosphatidyltransferase family protein [Clostridia bacterium]|nr:CDP-alcohol phosphatidyltransferase family protein [Clostridia bacterium]